MTPKGIYLSRCDLENDLGEACEEELKRYAGKTDIDSAVAYLQEKKAVRMREFLTEYGAALRELGDDHLTSPLKRVVELASPRKRKVESDVCLF